MMGYIIKNRQMAIGMDTTGDVFTYMARPSKNVAIPGANFPIIIPDAMHNITQSERYFSNTFKFRSILSWFMGMPPDLKQSLFGLNCYHINTGNYNQNTTYLVIFELSSTALFFDCVEIWYDRFAMEGFYVLGEISVFYKPII
jgi:hypothetical protein